MTFFSPIVISQQIQQSDSRLQWKALAASVALHGSLLAAALNLYAYHNTPEELPSERITISLSDFTDDTGDHNRLESSGKPVERVLPKPLKAPTKPLVTHHVQPTSSVPATTPLEKPTATPPVSPEASAPLERAVSMPASSSSDAPIDSPQSPPTPVYELPKSSLRGNEIGGAALGHIRSMIESAITYPTIARKLHLEGVVTVSFVLNSDGTIKLAKVESTSGSRLLDTKAVETILSLSGDYPKLGKTVELSIPIAFSLTKS